MSENKSESKKKIYILIAIILILAVLAACWFAFFKDKGGSGAGEVVAWDVNNEDTAGATAGISIPGYTSMVFESGKTTQKVNMGNPKGNSCYFVITLKLSDGKVLYESDYLEPGQGLSQIKLKTSLPAGEYTAVAQYSCYSLEDKSPLNGASSEFKLIVE